MKVKKMKGIIVEKNNENCVLLQSDGTFRTVKTSADLEIGTVIYINNTVRSVAFYLKEVIPMVAALFIVAFLGVGVYSWTNPVQYINIDINPSVELAVNRYDRIIKMSPLNDDGEKLLESVDFLMKKYEKGINDVIETARDMGYLEENGDVLISISSSNRELRLKTQAEIVDKVTEDAEVLVFDSTEHDQSARDGLSPGKSNIIDKVIESGTNLTEEELAAAPVKDLMLRIRENKKMNLELEKEAKQREKLQKEIEKAGQKQKDESNGKNNGNQGNQGNQGSQGSQNNQGSQGNQGNQGRDKNSDNDNPLKEKDKTENGKQEGKAEKEDKDSTHKDDKDSVKDNNKSQGNNGIQQQKDRNDSIAADKNSETSSGNKAGKESDLAGKSSDKDEAAADGGSKNGNSSGNNDKASENPSQDKKNTVDKNINVNEPTDQKNNDSKDDENDKKEYIEQNQKEKLPPVGEKGSEGSKKDVYFQPEG